MLSVTTNSNDVFLAGGYVGVDPALIADGTIGRLVQYSTGTFTTVCRTDQVLWWATAARDGSGAIFAAGEGGRVIRYQGGRCDTLNLDVTYPEGAPTFFGAVALSSTDVWLVGGSALPTGPRGVLVHWNGTTFTQEATLPTRAQHANLFKIDSDGMQLFVVGTQGTVIERDTSGAWREADVTVRTEDNSLFTVSCASSDCWAVGGTGVALNLHRQGMDGGVSSWASRGSIGSVAFDDITGLNGVWTQNPSNVWMVGNFGTTVHTNPGSSVAYRVSAETTATLHSVGGNSSVVIAAGGELSVTNATQRGVILVRGDSSPQFTFDGQTFQATGDLRSSLGGTGQGGR